MSQRSFTESLSIKAAPDTVWAALTQDHELCRWFAPDAAVTPGEGGSVEWRWGERYRWPQRIETWEPSRRLRTVYDSAVAGADGVPCPLWMEFTIEADAGGGTTLRLVHSGFGPEASFDEEFDGISRGWPVELRSLRHYLERHAGEDRHVAWSVAPLGDRGQFDLAWRALTGADGFGGGALQGKPEGAPFTFMTVAGTRFSGRVLSAREHEFVGVADSHGDAFLRFTVEACGNDPQVWLWCACYGDAGRPVAAALQSEFDGMLRSLFGEASAAGPAVERGAS